MNYDSTRDTLQHIRSVQAFLSDVIDEMMTRGIMHDVSKLDDPEKSMYDEFTPKLKGVTYGSDEYKEYLDQMGVALKHHYEHNRHHPEHFEWGIHEMNLIDLIEMLCDWKAASLRHGDGDMVNSLEINRKRFDIEDQLYNIFANSIRDFGWD